MISFPNLCNLMNEGKNEKFCVGYHISPIKKKDYNFFITASADKMKMIYGSHGANEYLEFVKNYVPQKCSYTEFLQNVAPTKEFISAYKEHFYQELDLTNDIERLVSTVSSLDFSTPQTRHGGLDGFSLYCWMPTMSKVFSVWCCHYDEYYSSVTDLANAVLDAINVDEEYRFSVYKGGRK